MKHVRALCIDGPALGAVVPLPREADSWDVWSDNGFTRYDVVPEAIAAHPEFGRVSLLRQRDGETEIVLP
jgi:hypothetical protein